MLRKKNDFLDFTASKVFFNEKIMILTLFKMGFFGAAHGWGAKKVTPSKICQTYPTIMKLGTVMF